MKKLAVVGKSDKLAGIGDSADTYAAMGGAPSKDYRNGMVYTMTFENTGSSAVDRTIAIHPGFLTELSDMLSPNGVAVAGVMTEGNVVTAADANLVASGDSVPVDQFIKFFNENPTAFASLRVEVDDKSQLGEPFQIQKLNIFEGHRWQQKIVPSLHRDPSQLDDKNVDVPLHQYNFQLDNQTLLIYKIKAGRTVKLSWSVSEIFNTAAILDMKRKTM